MSFGARLGSDEISVEAGATTPLTIEITNKGEQACEFEISIEGLDAEWTAIPIPLCTVAAGDTQTEKIFLKPSRASESTAGSYPFVVKIRSFEDNEVRPLPGSLLIKPYHHLSLEISPKKGFVSALRSATDFEATIMNLGNAPHTVQVFASDPEEDCAFEFDQAQIVLEPGQQKSVIVEASPKKSRLMSGKLIGFNVSARSIENPSLVAIGQAQIEQRPVISITAIIALVVVLILAGLWIAFIPRAPAFNLRVDKTSVQVGQPVTIYWSPAYSDEKVHIEVLNAPVYDGSGSEGQVVYTPTTSGMITVTGYAERNNQKSDDEPLTLTVTQPPTIADPVIKKFYLDQSNIALGSPITIHYQIANATKLVLLPLGKELDPSVDELQITADNLRTKAYTLVAYNSAGKTVQKTIPVSISQLAKAKIIAFSSSETKLAQPGQITLNWQCNSQSVRVELSDGSQSQVVQEIGSQTITLSQTTTFVLTAFDDQGIALKKSIKVLVLPPPVIPPPAGGAQNPPTSDTGGSGGAATAGPTAGSNATTTGGTTGGSTATTGN